MRTLLICLLLLASPTLSHSEAADDIYPIEISDFGGDRDFPKSAAGYTRVEVVAYAAAMTNYSVGYNLYEGDIQNAVTLYLYEVDASFEQLYEFEKQQILSAHSDAIFVNESSSQLEKSGVKYAVRTANFRYTGQLAGREQPLFSQLVLIEHPSRFVKARSTAPIAQAHEAETHTAALLDAVNWAYKP